jgi:membrane protease YdiL (CAAX protease family)
VRWLPGEWRAFGEFLHRPALPQRVTGIRLRALASTLRLFALDLALMALILGLIGLASMLGFKAPANAIDKIHLGPTVLALIVLILPMGEELVFRSWLSGRAGHVVAAATVMAGLAILLLSGPQPHPVLALGAVAITAALAAGAAFWLRGRPPMPFFGRHFAAFYFASSLLFALAHLSNYSQGAALILLPLVIPQLVVGLILGYARVTYGLWSDMLLHIMHNALLIALVILQKGGL